MARLPRLTLPGYPHHVIQRGNNRQPIFSDRQDFERLLALWRQYAPSCGVAIHAYVLMENHFHLLAMPQTLAGLSLLMQSVGRSYVRYFNQRHARSGTLWEGRYRSTVVEPAGYLLDSMVYIDLNPVRSGQVAQAADWPWSSAGHYLGLRHDPLITPHAGYWSLGNTPFAREAAYAERLQTGLAMPLQKALADAALHGWVLGSEAFLAELQKQSPRRLLRGKAGRPAKPAVVRSATHSH